MTCVHLPELMWRACSMAIAITIPRNPNNDLGGAIEEKEGEDDQMDPIPLGDLLAAKFFSPPLQLFLSVLLPSSSLTDPADLGQGAASDCVDVNEPSRPVPHPSVANLSEVP